MTLAQLEDTLPNGFHDAVLHGVDVRIDENRVILRMAVDLGVYPTPGPLLQEAEVILDSLQMILFDAADPRGRLEAGQSPDINGFTPTETQFPGLSSVPGEIRKNLHSIYLGGDWKCFLHVAGEAARIVWKNSKKSEVELARSSSFERFAPSQAPRRA